MNLQEQKPNQWFLTAWSRAEKLALEGYKRMF